MRWLLYVFDGDAFDLHGTWHRLIKKTVLIPKVSVNKIIGQAFCIECDVLFFVCQLHVARPVCDRHFYN